MFFQLYSGQREAVVAFASLGRKEFKMKAEVNETSRVARQPLSALGKTTVRVLIGMVIVSGILALFSSPLFIFTLIALVCTVLVARGIRWASLLAAIASGAIVVYMFQNSASAYLLTHPKDALGGLVVSFALFVVILLDICIAIAAAGTSLATFVQNFRQGEQQRPRWLTPFLTGMAGVFVGAILIVGILPVGASAGTASVNGMPTVHMGIDSFAQSTVTVPKGSKLLLVDDAPSVHFLANGYWVNNTPHPTTEPGAPSVKNLQIKSGSVEIGPFTVAGTYHLYCTVHPGMNLTIIVQ
jgi:hypothetical protein